MIIWLASYPRSGNTYARIVWHYCYGLKTYSAHDDNRAVTTKELSNLIGVSPGRPKTDEICLIKSHRARPYKANPAIYLVRDGRSVMVSAAHHAGVSVREAVLGDIRFGEWSGHVYRWTHRRVRPHVIRFEDLVSSNDPGELFDPILEELGLTMPRSHGVPSTFEELHEKNPEFFRRGRIDSWRDEMSDEDHELFWKLHGDTMEMLNYRKDGTYGDLPKF